MKLVAMTACCVDFYPQIGKSFLGGNSLNFAAQARLSAPDAEVAMVSAIGTDDVGKRILDFLTCQNISTRFVHVQEGKSTTNHIVNDEHGERFGVPGTWDGGVTALYLLSSEALEFVSEHDIIAVPANNINFETVVQKKSSKNMLVVDFLDEVNGMPIDQNFHRADIAFLAGEEKRIEHYQHLANNAGTLLVMTMGAQGSAAFFQGKTYRQEALPVSNVVDTTGCGDAFQAAFTVAYYKTKSIPDALHAGAFAGSNTLQHYGGVVEE
jgi:fructoselysine 6-kinase